MCCLFSVCFATLDILLAVLIADQEYPVRPAFSLLSKLLDDFTAKVPQSSFGNPASISFPDVNAYLEKYQDPRQADTIMKVQQELDETKIVLVRWTFTSSHKNDALTRHNVAQNNRVSPAARRKT